MNKALKTLTVLILCMSLSMGLLAGCGGSSEETTAVPETTVSQDDEIFAVNACYDNNELKASLILKDDFTLTYSDADLQFEADYYTDGNIFHMENEDMTLDGLVTDEGGIAFDGVEGTFCEVNEITYFPVEEEKRSISSSFNNDTEELSLDFFSDFTVTLSNSNGEEEGTYYILGNQLFLDIDGDTCEGSFFNDEEFELDNFEGIFTMGDDILYLPDEEPDYGEELLSIPSGGNKSIERKGEKLVYSDYDGGISIKYPEGMTNFQDALGSGTVLISDGNRGYVLGVNMTDVYTNFDGSNEDFITALMDDGLLSTFEALYGEADHVEPLSFVAPEDETEEDRIITASTRFYNDEYSINLDILLYQIYIKGEPTDRFTLKCFYSDMNNPDQLDTLWNEVRSCMSLE